MKQSTPQSNVTPRYSSLQITTTPRGRALPIVYGANKVTSDIVWAADFHNVPFTQNTGNHSGKGIGGGGGGGKGGGGGSTQFYYFAALLGTLCEGPIFAFVAARNGSNWVYFNGNSPPFAWPVTSQWPSASPGIVAFEGYPLLAQLGQNTTVAASNLMPWEVATLQSNLYVQYEESGMVDDLNNVNPSRNQGFQQAGENWQNIGANSWASQALMLMPGTSPQPYPPYIGANHPSQIATYQYAAYWFSPAYQLGQSATPPTLDWFIVGLFPFDPFGSITGTPIVDSEPIAVITDIVTNPVRGACIASIYLDSGGTIANYRSFCAASGLFLSAVLNSQIETTQILNLIMQQTVSVCFWSEGLLKIVPWYDLSVTGHGFTFTPNLTPVYTLTDQHLLDQKSTGPVECQRSSIFDTYNQLNLNFNNRALNYSTDTITVDDQGSQQVWGVRPAPPAMAQYIADASVAAASAQLQLNQLIYSRNTYTFSLPFVFCLLEPMDILLLNDPGMGIVGLPVRVQQLSLNNNDEYQITAQNIVDELFGIQARNQQVSLGSGLPASVPPGSVEPPFIFTGPTRITGQELEVWIAVSGAQQGWGGCNVWMSTDGTNYEKVGHQWGGSRFGYVASPVASFGSANPDTVDTLYLYTIGPNNQLSSVSAAQAAQGLTLMLIQTGSNFELLSYQTATLNGVGSGIIGNIYTLSTLYRGLAGTFGIGHNYADRWARLDGNITKVHLNVAMMGQTVYFKFASFNTLGGMTEALSQVAAYPYTVTSGTSSPVGVSGLTIGTDGKFVILTWDADNSPEVVGYQIRYGTTTQSFAQAKPVINEISSTHTVSLIVTPGTWTFWVASYDKLGQFSSTIQSATFTVQTFQLIYSEQNYGALVHPLDPGATLWPDWQGTNATFTNCRVHPTAWTLIPTDGALASFSGSDLGWEWVDDFCITPPASSTYVSPAINIGPGQTNVRGSVQLYEYLWGVAAVIPGTSQLVQTLQPDWAAAGLTLTGCFAHPTAWVIVPTDTLAASYSGADNGFEVFDFTVYAPPATSTVVQTINAGGILPVQALLNTSVKPGPGGSVPVMTGAIAHSGDNSHWVALSSQNGAGQCSGIAVDQYFQFSVTLNNSAGQQTIYSLPPNWSGVTLSGAILHPTSYVIAPADTILASYSGADNGFEVFDNYVYAPPAGSSVSFIANAGLVTTVQAGLNSSIQAGPGQTLAAPGSGLYNAAIGYSNSPTGPFTTLTSGNATGTLNGTATAQYFQFQVSLTNLQGNLVTIQNMVPKTNTLTPTSGGIGTLRSMLAELIIAPSQYWTPVIPQIRNSPDGSTWGPWQPIPSTFTNQQYVQFQVQWSIIGALWPFGIDSVWLLCDGTPLNQTGSVTTVAGTATVLFATPYRQASPIVTATVKGSSSIVASIVSVSANGFVVDTFTSTTGAAVNAIVHWSATGI